MIFSKRVVTAWTIALVLLAGFIVLGGCVPTQPLSAQVKAVCGVPADDLSNVDQYATCVNSVLDVYNEQHRAP